tara:strand:+ start:20934 stop:21614 length:681 start_codon:yes stop_codon:yes gene_type:complete
MYFTLVSHPCMAITKHKVKLSRRVVHDLKEISKLSSVKQWEFAGDIKYENSKFSKPTRVTSKKRSQVDSKELVRVWNSEISYHTHTGIGYNDENVCENTPIFTTLPSNSDFVSYIKGFPQMQVNIICDAHGYYVIDIFDAAYSRASPLPEAVFEYMRHLRSIPFMRICVFSDDTAEYFQTTIKNWKKIINEEVHSEMKELFGISITYYRYDEEPPDITIYQDIYVA